MSFDDIPAQVEAQAIYFFRLPVPTRENLENGQARRSSGIGWPLLETLKQSLKPRSSRSIMMAHPGPPYFMALLRRFLNTLFNQNLLPLPELSGQEKNSSDYQWLSDSP